MRVELLVVGAHTGRKLEKAVRAAAARGAVILVEPVPWLFAELQETFAGTPNVTFLNCCIAEDTGRARFHAPLPGARGVLPWGDQLGSLRAGHAADHHPDMAAHVTELDVDAVSFADLLSRLGIVGIDTLFTDTEGYDAVLLAGFPFDRLRPRRIVFEHKHADGTMHLGRHFAALILLLDAQGYRTRVLDVENCIAVLPGASDPT